jgi:hypothetical protein
MYTCQPLYLLSVEIEKSGMVYAANNKVLVVARTNANSRGKYKFLLNDISPM